MKFKCWDFSRNTYLFKIKFDMMSMKKENSLPMDWYPLLQISNGSLPSPDPGQITFTTIAFKFNVKFSCCKIYTTKGSKKKVRS